MRAVASGISCDVTAGGSAPTLQVVAGGLVSLAVCFNAILAVLNAHVVALGPDMVVAAEVGIVGAAHVVALAQMGRGSASMMAPWYGFLALTLVIALMRSLATETFDAKSMRDVAIIPTFVVLGMTFDPKSLNRLVVGLHTIVLTGLVFEALDTQAYSALFEIKRYYIETRGVSAGAFWNSESDLFVSATRPDGRLLQFVDLHRLSSIFLEPVSLGNYCMVIVAFVLARAREMSRPVLIYLVLGTVVMAIGCDSRLALVTSVVMISVAVLAERLPRYSAALYVPAVLIAAAGFVALTGALPGGDDLRGRVAHTVFLLGSYEVGDFLGVSGAFLDKAVDSGIAYLIATQSIVGVVLMWIAIVALSRDERRDQVRYLHAISIYIALSMIVTYSLLSIKTAALLWFIHGSLQRDTSGRRAVAA